MSQAVPSLLRMMGVRQADYADIEVVLAGGASMFGPRNGRLQVGRQMRKRRKNTRASAACR